MAKNKLSDGIFFEAQEVKLDNPAKCPALFKNFWERCIGQITKDEVRKQALNTQLSAYRKHIVDMNVEFSKFQQSLKEMPIAVAIGDWIKELMHDTSRMERYLKVMERLQEKRLVPLLDSQGNPETLAFFMKQGHQEILENIRCVLEWTLLEKEEAIQCYVTFSRSLSRQTLGLIPHGFDPDRDRVRQKAVNYEVFIDFVQGLSDRDALIAKLLYFGAPSIDEVLSLKKNAIDPTSYSIQFARNVVVFPRHVICDLFAYFKEQNQKQTLVFANVRGAEVERAHLNQSFSRACDKMSVTAKITPGSLLKLENEKDENLLYENLKF